MYKHKCKLCMRRFSNGRALGGHMRSHMMNLPLPPKPLPTKPAEESFPRIQLSFEAESTSSSSSEEVVVANEDDVKGVCYGLREKHPKTSVHAEDPEISSVILQDRERVTESSKMRNPMLLSKPSNYRSKRTRNNNCDCNNKGKQVDERDEAMMTKKMKLSKAESWVVDGEPLSPLSDVSTEEEVAFFLMMLSRDRDIGWKIHKDQEQLMVDQCYGEEDNDDDDEGGEEDEAERVLSDDTDDDAMDEEEEEEEEEVRLSTNRVRGRRYKCETCNKGFRSYQALGGHRASHKKIKVKVSTVNNDNQELENENSGTSAPVGVQKKIHECPVCYRVFASGQALGGHKRTHGIGLAAAAAAPRAQTDQVPFPTAEHGNNLIDLNLPASIDDDWL